MFKGLIERGKVALSARGKAKAEEKEADDLEKIIYHNHSKKYDYVYCEKEARDKQIATVMELAECFAESPQTGDFRCPNANPTGGYQLLD